MIVQGGCGIRQSPKKIKKKFKKMEEGIMQKKELLTPHIYHLYLNTAPTPLESSIPPHLRMPNLVQIQLD